MSNKTSAERRFCQRPTLHHRRPKEIGGSTRHQRNFSRVPWNKHQAWHLLFGIDEAPVICKEINEHWLDPDYEFICVKKEQK